MGIVYRVLAYAVSLATMGYLLGFVENLWVPKSIDLPDTGLPLLPALAIDLALIALFGLQHTAMARPAFKARITKIIPRPLERSTYLFATCAMFALLFFAWQPLTTPIWTTTLPIRAIGFIGWATAVASTFMIDHFALFGLRAETNTPFQTNYLYKLVRHPIMTGFLIALWAAQAMTLGRLIFASAMTAYIMIGTRYEERDLVNVLGDDYRRYKERVSMLLPLPIRRK
jgi:methanethiol S-methyltransferase